MIYLLLGLLVIFFCLDGLNFSRYNAALTRKVFHFEKIIFLTFLLSAILILCSPSHPWKALAQFTFFYTATFYFIRRRRLLKLLPSEPDIVSEEENDTDAEKRMSRKQQMLIIAGAMGVIYYWFYGMCVLSSLTVVVFRLIGLGNYELLEMVLMTFVSSGFVFYLIYRVSPTLSKQGFADSIRLAYPENSAHKVFIVPALLGVVFAACSAYIMINRVTPPETPLSEVLGENPSALVVVFLLFLAVIVAPFIEEVVFRGYFFRVFRQFMGRMPVIIIIGLTFALLHVPQYWGDWLAIGMVTLLGLVLTFLREWSGSTLSSIITHYVYNAGVTIIPVIYLMTSNPSYFDYQAYSQEYDTPKKEKLLLESIKVQPDLAEAYNELAKLYAHEHIKLEDGLSLIDQALSYYPEKTDFLDTKAEILYHLNRYEESILIRREILNKKDLSEKKKDYIERKIKEVERAFSN
ncbi:MAG: CPBP family intramembrane metalloprotease [Candidatus Omnitrophica bacterium]|nr:CPBP family intramembrane metalloprotease [Candidatus Omnitrophota bacterium]